MDRSAIVGITALLVGVALITYGFTVSISYGFTLMGIFFGSMIINILISRFVNRGRR